MKENMQAIQLHIEKKIVDMDSFITIDDIKEEINNIKILQNGLDTSILELAFYKGFTKLNDSELDELECILIDGFKHRIR